MDQARATVLAISMLAVGLSPVAASLVDGLETLPETPATEAPTSVCEGAETVRTRDVVARQIPISYNKWGDFDPFGRLFIPAEKEQAVVDQVSHRLVQAGFDTVARTLEDPGVQTLTEIGYGFPDDVSGVPRTEPFQPSDLVQPLVLRAHIGDCVEIHLENKLPEPVSLHVHNAVTRPGQGMALGENTVDVTPSGETGTYHVKIPDDPAMEGAHFLHSHADARYQTKHGLFGAIMAEPKGTSWLTPEGEENPTGPMAMITHPEKADYREVSVFYHDEIELVDRSLNPLPELSPYGEYGPGTKGMNLRTEPFFDRFKKHDELERRGELDREHDDSLALSSYTYGDPPVMPRSYVGDPTKFRLVNVGPGQAHVHHLHGGGIRWRMSPVGEDTNLTDGLTKYERGGTHEHHPAEDHPTAPHTHGTADPTASLETTLATPTTRGAGSILLADAERLSHGDRIAIGEDDAREVRRVEAVYGNRVTLDRALLEDHSFRTTVTPLDAETASGHDHDGAATASTSTGTGDDVNANLDTGEYHPHNERTDVQMLSPGVSFNAEIECGAGGCQQSPGDFLFHCHIAEHYIAGMWGFWRTYNTLQDDLAELPDRQGQTPAPVNSTELVGTTLPNGTTLTEDNVRGWIEDQLPPQGEAEPNGASVWDWTVDDTDDGPLYKGEPETSFSWPNYEPDDPGSRDPLEFHPDNGRLAFPFLEPHLGKRPPFAPGHGPAPYLGQEIAGDAPDRLCPASTRPLNYSVVATGADVDYNDAGDTDTDGMVFAHAENADAVQRGDINPPPLVLRANRGDCVDVTFTSQLPQSPGENRKVNIHTHLVQFDMQATDGSIVGFNYETSVRPADETGATLAEPAQAGDTTIEIDEASDLIREGALVGVSVTQPEMEAVRVASVDGTTVTLAEPLTRDHAPGVPVSPEFVRYRWYTDVRLGTVYFHDHVDGLETWRHGLFGALIVEPRDSRWLDPARAVQDPSQNEDVLNQHVVDIVGPNGTYRELVNIFQDNSAVMDGRALSSFNLRSEPFDRRPGMPLSSPAHGDPSTKILRAYPGDDVTIRLLYGGQATSKGVATFGVTGHRFTLEPESAGAAPRDAVSWGISEQHNFQLECGAGGCDRLPGDYLYYITQPELFERGAWGILRVHDTPQPDLQPLPVNEDWSTGEIPDRTDRSYEVVALETNVTFNARTDTTAPRKVFVPADQADAVADDEIEPHPLVLRASAGEVVEVELTNRLDEPVSLHAGMVAANATSGDLGIPIGHNGPATVAPGETGTYRWHADRAVGISHMQSFAKPAAHPREGLYGAFVVEPAGATFDSGTGITANVTLPGGTVAREHVLVYASHDPSFEASVMPYSTAVDGITSIDYRTAPIWNRTGARVPATGVTGDPVGGPAVHTCQIDTENCQISTRGKGVRTGVRHPLNPVAYSSAVIGDPATPVLTAEEGQPVIVRAVTGTGDQIQSHTLPGHSWERDPAMHGSRVIDTETIGMRETSNAWIPAAGPGGPGDYLYASHRDAFREAGAWGLLRVQPSG